MERSLSTLCGDVVAATTAGGCHSRSDSRQSETVQPDAATKDGETGG